MRLIFCAALLLGTTARAESDDPTVLPPWVVAESRLRPEVAAIRASAWLAADSWSERSIGTLADAFRHIPGAVMQESFGGFEPPRLSIRGSGVQSAPSSRGLALRLDQLPLGLADGSFNAALFDPLLGATVEVQRGIDGWRAAPATMGGALDVRSAAGSAPESAALRFEAGSFGAGRVRGTAERRRGTSHVSAAFGYSTQDGYREHSGQARATALATMGRSISDGTNATLGVYHARARYDVPGPLTLAQVSIMPRGISADVRRDQPDRVSDLTRLSAHFAHRSTEWEIDCAAGLAHSADEFRQLQANGITTSRSDDASLHLAFARRFAVGAMPHQIRLVADATRGWRDLKRYRNDAGQRGAQFGDDRVYATTATWQIEDAFALTPRLVGTAGLARVTARRDIAPSGGGSRVPWRGGRTLPQAGLRWNAMPDIALFADVSTAIEPPTFDDLLVVEGSTPALSRRANPLAAQRATTVECGVRGRARNVAWDAAIYDATWRNEILRLADAQGLPRGAVNAGHTRHTGVEAAAHWLVVERPIRLAVLASATWSLFRFDDDPVFGNRWLAGFPPLMGCIDMIADFPAGYFAAAGADGTHGRTRVDHAGRLGYGGRGIAHARIGRRRGEYTGYIEIRNVFDRGGIASTAGVLDIARNPASTSIFLPATGRSINVGLEWKR